MKTLTCAVALLVSTSTLLTGAPSSAAGAGDQAVVTVLSHAKVGGHAVVTTSDGTVVAIWERARSGRTRILAATRPVGEDWQSPELVASWSPADVLGDAGEPRLVTGPGGSVVAVWVNAARRIVRATWQPGSGWTSPQRLSGKQELAVGPSAASNDLGQVAVTWQRRTTHRGVLVRSAVQRGSDWFVSTVGKQGPRGLGAEPALVGIDDAGNVSAAWYRLRPKPAHSGDGLEEAQSLSLASRLAAGSTTWETPHSFVADWEPFLPGDHTSLVVQDDGTAWVGDWPGAWNAPQPGPMWTRESDGPWTADDRAPYADSFVTNDPGELLSWIDIAERVSTRQEDGSWTSADIRASAVVLDDVGHAATLRIEENQLVVRVRDALGAWGPEQVLVDEFARDNDRADDRVVSTSIGDDGTVTVLWRTYGDQLPGDEPENGPDLRSVQFSAMSGVGR